MRHKLANIASLCLFSLMFFFHNFPVAIFRGTVPDQKTFFL